MSFPTTARRVAVFTILLFTSWVAVTASASAMLPEPPDTSVPGGSAATDSGLDLTVWLLVALAVVVVVAVAAGVATTLHRRHIHPGIARPVVH